MKSIDVKKLIINGTLAAGICMGGTACSTAQASVESSNDEPITTSISETTVTTTPESKIEIVTEATTPVTTVETTAEPVVTTFETEVMEVTELPVVTTVATTIQETKKTELTKEDIVSMSKEYGKYLSSKEQAMVNQTMGVSYEKKYDEKDLYGFVFVMNEKYISAEEKDRLINDGIISSSADQLLENAGNLASYIGFCNGTYMHFMNVLEQTKDDKVIMSASSATIDEKLKADCLALDKNLISYLKKNDETQCVNDYVSGNLYRYSLPKNYDATDCLTKLTYDYAYVMYSAQFLGDNIDSIQKELNDDVAKMKTCLENSNTKQKQKVLTNN